MENLSPLTQIMIQENSRTQNWHFINARDDDFDIIEKYLEKNWM